MLGLIFRKNLPDLAHTQRDLRNALIVLPFGTCRLRSTSSSFFYKADEPEQDAGSDEGHDDRCDQAAALKNPDHAEDPSTDYGADDADDDVHQDAEAAALHDFSGEEAGDSSNDAPPE